MGMGGSFSGALGDPTGLAWALSKARAETARAEVRLAGIRSFLAEVEPNALAVLPAVVDGWKSPAALLYADRLQQARGHIVAMLEAATAAEQSAWNELDLGQMKCEELADDLRSAKHELAEREAAHSE